MVKPRKVAWDLPDAIWNDGHGDDEGWQIICSECKFATPVCELEEDVVLCWNGPFGLCVGCDDRNAFFEYDADAMLYREPLGMKSDAPISQSLL